MSGSEIPINAGILPRVTTRSALVLKREALAQALSRISSLFHRKSEVQSQVDRELTPERAHEFGQFFKRYNAIVADLSISRQDRHDQIARIGIDFASNPFVTDLLHLNQAHFATIAADIHGAARADGYSEEEIQANQGAEYVLSSIACYNQVDGSHAKLADISERDKRNTYANLRPSIEDGEIVFYQPIEGVFLLVILDKQGKRSLVYPLKIRGNTKDIPIGSNDTFGIILAPDATGIRHDRKTVPYAYANSVDSQDNVLSDQDRSLVIQHEIAHILSRPFLERVEQHYNDRWYGLRSSSPFTNLKMEAIAILTADTPFPIDNLPDIQGNKEALALAQYIQSIADEFRKQGRDVTDLLLPIILTPSHLPDSSRHASSYNPYRAMRGNIDRIIGNK